MNVLSIDIDVFFKCMDYQNYMDEDLLPLQSWQVINWKADIKHINKDVFNIDLDTFKKVQEILKLKCKNASVHTINEHDEIIKILESLPTKNNHVTNIDTHHDITYGRDDSKLTIENWVKHGRKDNLILDYLWICRDESEKCKVNTFNYICSSWKDIDPNALPEYDVVVFCRSPYFTPPKYWSLTNDLYLYMYNNIKNEFCQCSQPNFDIKNYPNFDGYEETDGKDVKTTWYRYFDFYVLMEKYDDIKWLSFINLGDGKLNVLSPCRKLLNRLIENSKVGFAWDRGYKSEVLIRRLAKPHKVISNKETDRGYEWILIDKED